MTDPVVLRENLKKPLPLYSKTMRKYVVETSLDLLRRKIAKARRDVADGEKEMEVLLSGICHWGDVTLTPHDVFVYDNGPDCISDARQWEDLLAHFHAHGAAEEGHDEVVHCLRTRQGVRAYCKDHHIPIPAWFESM